MKFTPFSKRLLIQVGIAVGGILIISISILLLNKDIDRRASIIKQFKTDIAIRDGMVDLLSDSKLNLERSEEALNKLEDILPNSDELINFPREIESLGSVFDVGVGFSFGNQSEGSDSSPGSIAFTMTLSGEYNDLVSFLEALEEHRYFISLSSIDIKQAKDDPFTLLTTGLIFTD